MDWKFIVVKLHIINNVNCVVKHDLPIKANLAEFMRQKSENSVVSPYLYHTIATISVLYVHQAVIALVLHFNKWE